MSIIARSFDKRLSGDVVDYVNRKYIESENCLKQGLIL